MQVPTARSPFGELPPLDPGHEQSLSDLATALVDLAIDEYDHFVQVQKRRLPRSEWKPVRKVENLTLYRQRRSSPVDDSASRFSQSAITSSASAPFEVEPDHLVSWSLPKVVTVGTLSGSLEDVMLGLSSPDAASMLRKAAYSKEEVVDAEVLFQIEQPTEDAPFSFLGVKWMVVELHPMSRRRDFVYMESTGIRTLSDGRRIGFVLTHSLDEDQLDGCGSLERSHNILRARMSSCYLFSAADSMAHSVDVYMKGFVQPSGKMVDALAISTSATVVLQFFAHAVECAQHLKLAHKVETVVSAKPDTEHQLVQVDEPQQRARSATSVWIHRRKRSDKDKARCSVCYSSGGALAALKLFRSTSGNSALGQRPTVVSNGMSACDVCCRQVCGKCRMMRKIWLASPAASASKPRSKQLQLSTVVVCTACVVESNSQNAADVARANVKAMIANGSGHRSVETRPISSSECGPSPVSVRASTFNPSSSHGPISGWRHEFASTRATSSRVGMVDIPTSEEFAAITSASSTSDSRRDDELESIVNATVRAPEASGLEPASASIVVMEIPEDVVKAVKTASVSDRRTRLKSQPNSECESTDRESFIGYDDEDELSDTVVVYSNRSAAYSSVSPSSGSFHSDRSPPSSQGDMWARIAELRRNAEDVYQMTLRTTVTMTASASLASSCRGASPMDDLD